MRGSTETLECVSSIRRRARSRVERRVVEQFHQRLQLGMAGILPDGPAVDGDRRELMPLAKAAEKPFQHPLDEFDGQLRIVAGDAAVKVPHGIAQPPECVRPNSAWWSESG